MLLSSDPDYAILFFCLNKGLCGCSGTGKDQGNLIQVNFLVTNQARTSQWLCLIQKRNCNVSLCPVRKESWIGVKSRNLFCLRQLGFYRQCAKLFCLTTNIFVYNGMGRVIFLMQNCLFFSILIQAALVQYIIGFFFLNLFLIRVDI